MLKDAISEDIKRFMKNGEKVKLSALRMLNSNIQNRMIELRKDTLSEDETLAIIAKQVKRHRESIDQFQAAGREDLVEVENEQMETLARYLPEQLTEDELLSIVSEVLDRIDAVSQKDMGLAMKHVLSKTKGRADGSMVSRIVIEQLKKRGEK